MKNGDISMFPREMYKAFSSKKILVTPSLLNKIVGGTEIKLNEYDIYAMGKKKGCKRIFT